MRYLLLALLAFFTTNCNSYNNCAKPCAESCVSDAAKEPMAPEQPAEQVAAEMPTEAPVVAEVSEAPMIDLSSSLKEIGAQFQSVAKERLNLTPLLTVTSTPPNGVSTMITTPDAFDIPGARDVIVKTAEMLIEIVNSNSYVREKATNYPLTAADLDIIIDSNQVNSPVRSVSLIRGMIEYEARDPETNAYRVVKQEPFSHSQAKNETTNCCGSYFVAKKKS